MAPYRPFFILHSSFFIQESATSRARYRQIESRIRKGASHSSFFILHSRIRHRVGRVTAR
ncbi:MAG: hypothetical protein SPD44_06535 [Prevotella sp.]|nr:hypothetical protein [Prevotella sp.]